MSSKGKTKGNAIPKRRIGKTSGHPRASFIQATARIRDFFRYAGRTNLAKWQSCSSIYTDEELSYNEPDLKGDIRKELCSGKDIAASVGTDHRRQGPQPAEEVPCIVWAKYEFPSLEEAYPVRQRRPNGSAKGRKVKKQKREE